MGLLNFFKPAAPATPAGGDSAQAIGAARTRARRRLIGAVLLLGIGVIAFPLLFETQPRPIPVDIAIEIPRKEGAAPLALPAPRASAPVLPVVPTVPAASKPAVATPVITESKTEAGKEVAAPMEVAAKSTAKPAAPSAPVSAPASTPVENRPAAEAAGRFVVQVGAFADAASVRDSRAKVEKLGLKTYTQVVDTDAGKRTRVRLGPFVSRDEADKAAAKVKASGLPANVLTL